MADPIAQLQNYWIKVAADDADIEDLATAQGAMKNAIIAARYNPTERQRFAQAGIFTEALTKDRAGDYVVRAAWIAARNMGLDIDTRPVRVVMLDLIREIATGTSWYILKLDGGMTPWLASASASAPVFYKTLINDPSDRAVASAINILAEVGLPTAWVEYIFAQDPTDPKSAIIARVTRMDVPPRDREQMLSKLNVAFGTFLSNLSARQAAGQIEASSVETSGTGEPTETMGPAKPVPWHRTRRAGLAAVGALAALLGGVYQLRRRRS